MKALLIIMVMLAILFSFGLSAYISFFKNEEKTGKFSVVKFLTIGLATAALTVFVCTAALWPPVGM